MPAPPLLPLVGVPMPFLDQIAALLVAAVVIAYICYRLRLVPIAGFLIAGVAIGPHALGLVSEQQLVAALAEIGVILLLFTIGIEFSLDTLSQLRKAVVWGGGLQVALTVLIVTGVVVAAGGTGTIGMYTGCLIALSSTAIVLGLLTDRGMTESTVGRLSLAILIFQDLAIVVMVLLVPTLAGEGGSLLTFAGVIGTALALLGSVLLLARRVVPALLEQVARTRRQELFLLTVVAICFGTAAASALAGVSLALGAFLAGLVVSESRYREQALSDILPLRILFSAVFFVSVGMLLDMRFLLANLPLVLGTAVVVTVIKTGVVATSVLTLGYPLRIAGVTGITLSQIGEFSFVLERTGRDHGLSPAGLGTTGEQVFLAAAVLLMLLTPFAVQFAPRVDRLLSREREKPDGLPRDEPAAQGLEDHVIVIGHGPGGQRVVRVLQQTAIPYSVIDFNPGAIDELRREGVPAIYGDAGRRHILELARVHTAKMVVVVINDPPSTRRIVQLARHLNPTLQIVVRTRFLHEIESLQKLGADIVIPEEMETTVRIFAHVLGAYLIAPERIAEYVNELRSQDYGVLRGSIQEAHLMVLQGLDEEGLHTRAVAVRPGSPAAGRTLGELALRRRHHLAVLSVRRGNANFGSPDGDFVVEPDDRLLIVGTAEDFAASAELFRTSGPPPGALTAPDD